jgi:hypothetical protein
MADLSHGGTGMAASDNGIAMRRESMRAAGDTMPAGHGRLSLEWIGRFAGWFLLVVALFSTSAEGVSHRASRPLAEPGGELAGVWHGTGRIVNGWTGVQSLPIAIYISPAGHIAGWLGLARVTAASLILEAKPGSPKLALTVSLDGPLLEDGLARRSFHFRLKLEQGLIRGTGTSDGSKPRPWSEYASERTKARVDVVDIQLERVLNLESGPPDEPPPPRLDRGARAAPGAAP